MRQCPICDMVQAEGQLFRCLICGYEMHYPPAETVEERVVDRVRARAVKGLDKYGVTMERNDLTRLDWLQHAQDEALDLAV